MEEEISSPTLAIESIHPLFTKCDYCSILCAWFDRDISLPEDREIYTPIHTEDCLCWRDMDTVVEICPLTSESSLFSWDGECDIEISISIISSIPFATELDRHTSIDSLWNIDRFLDLFSEFSFCMTVMTLVYHSLSSSSTAPTRTSLLHDTEHCLYPLSYLSLPTT